jgi:hypothetical protein
MRLRNMEMEELKKRDLIPTKIKEVTTDVIQVGKIKALQIDKKARHRPCPMGTSGGHYMITAGTNGELLRDKPNSTYSYKNRAEPLATPLTG